MMINIKHKNPQKDPTFKEKTQLNSDEKNVTDLGLTPSGTGSSWEGGEKRATTRGEEEPTIAGDRRRGGKAAEEEEVEAGKEEKREGWALADERGMMEVGEKTAIENWRGGERRVREREREKRITR